MLLRAVAMGTAWRGLVAVPQAVCHCAMPASAEASEKAHRVSGSSRGASSTSSSHASLASRALSGVPPSRTRCVTWGPHPLLRKRDLGALEG